MQSNEKQISLKKYINRNDRSGMRKMLLIICVILLIAGLVFAKYIFSSRQQAEMESSQFHISSDYLEEKRNATDGNVVTYEMADWQDGFDILLYNYEKENTAQISAVDMTYTVTAGNANVKVMDKDNNPITANEGKYLFEKNEGKTCHVLHVTPAGAGKGNDISITVETTAPYEKQLMAIFEIQKDINPDYTITDQNNGTVLITVKTNSYEGQMEVEWKADKFSPDNTNDLMAGWQDSNHIGRFDVARNSTYELLFFKKTDVECPTTTGNGIKINLE